MRTHNAESEEDAMATTSIRQEWLTQLDAAHARTLDAARAGKVDAAKRERAPQSAMDARAVHE